MGKHVLVVDDEEGIVTLLRDYFEINEYRVSTAMNGEDALVKATEQPDLILLDVNMPNMDGMEVCARIRNHVSCPILFLTAKVEDADKIHGFHVGGDDYIVKPFSIEELGARVAAHLRREQRVASKTAAKFVGPFTIDYSERCMYYQSQPISLAKKEFDIVELLSMNAGQTFDRERIYESVWSLESSGDNNVVTEHIRRIRSKLTEYTEHSFIETVWGVGYKWVRCRQD